MPPPPAPKPSLLTTRHARLVAYIDIDESKQIDIESTTSVLRDAIVTAVDGVEDVDVSLVSKDWH